MAEGACAAPPPYVRLLGALRDLHRSLGRHPRRLFRSGLAIALAWTLYDAYRYIPLTSEFVQSEMSIRQDWRNLYEESVAASWRDIPKWFVGPWNYPGVGYYRPLTSILFLAEAHGFGQDFEMYNRVTWLMNAANAGLLFTLAFHLFGFSPAARLVAGLAAVYYFAPIGTSMEVGLMGTLRWWPAQNDALYSFFLLAELVLLERWTVRPNRALFSGALLAFVAAIGSKEAGHLGLPLALGMLAVRSKLTLTSVVSFVAPGLFLFFFRRLVVPNPWEPSLFSYRAFGKALDYWAHPVVWLAWNGIWWALAAGAFITGATVLAAWRRWRAWPVAAVCFAVTLACAQWVAAPGEGTFALAFDASQLTNLVGVLAYFGALVLFWRFRQEEPTLFAAWSVIVAFIPVVGYAGRHYFYFPSACAALANAAFVACVLRLSRGLLLREMTPLLSGRPA